MLISPIGYAYSAAVTTFFGRWRRVWPGGLSRAAGRPRVRLLAAPTRAPATPVEHVLVNALAAAGPLARRVLVSQAARTLYRDELAGGGWLADLGLLGERAFVPEVVHALEAGRGALWEVEAAA
jgi:hypothetical protein